MAPRSCRTAEGPPSTAEPARSRSLVPAELIEQRPQSLRVRARIVCTVTPIVTCADCPSIAQLIQARALSRGGVEYLTGHLTQSLRTFEGLLRAGFADGRELDELLTRLWRTNALAALDRTSEALQAADEMIADSL